VTAGAAADDAAAFAKAAAGVQGGLLAAAVHMVPPALHQTRSVASRSPWDTFACRLCTPWRLYWTSTSCAQSSRVLPFACRLETMHTSFVVQPTALQCWTNAFIAMRSPHQRSVKLWKWPIPRTPYQFAECCFNFTTDVIAICSRASLCHCGARFCSRLVL